MLKRETIDDLAYVGVLASLFLMVGHVEWSIETGNDLNGWLLLILFLIFMGCGIVEEKFLEEEEEKRK